jgi:hypothetical protein
MASADSAVGLEELRRVLTGPQYEWFTAHEAELLQQNSVTIYRELRTAWPGQSQEHLLAAATTFRSG